MTLKVPDVAKQAMLNAIRNDAVAGPVSIKLFTNNYTPDNTTTLGSLSECSFGGYSFVTLAGAAVGLNGSNEAELTYSDAVFTATGSGLPQDVYGYYVVDGAGGLLWAERDPTGPITLTTTGDSVTVSPKLTLTNVSPP